jgi:hypothetical protein
MIFDDDDLADLERAGTTLVEGILILLGVGFFLAVFLLWY